MAGAAAIVVAVLFMLGLPGPAAAAAPDFLLQMPESQVTPGAGAGELNNPRGIDGNPETGHVFISELGNARISEYTAWGLFVKAWGWGVADGANELQTCGPAQPEAAPPPGLCRKGLPGEGRGQMDGLMFGLTLDGAGNVYVFERANLRVQKFGPAGEFLLMFGGEVNKTKVEEGAPAAQQNRCPIAPTDVCQAATSGEAPGYFGGTFGNFIAYSPDANAIVVGDKDRIQLFNLDGTFKEGIPFEGELADFAGESVNALDVDEAGSIYFSLAGREDIYKLSGAGQPLAPGKPGESQFEVTDPVAVAVDVAGNVHAIEDEPTPKVIPEMSVVKFDASGKKLLPTKAEEDRDEFFPYVPFHGPSLTGLGTNICAGSEVPGNLYIGFFQTISAQASYVNAYDSAPIGCEPPPIDPPEILAQFASAVGREEATLKAQINPRFWTDATYYVEYGTGECSEGGCDQKAPLDPALLTSKSINRAVTTGGVILSGLQPGTTYHYRFVAESSGGGPVFGEDSDGREGPQEASFELGLERTFTAFAAAERLPCPNDASRAGAGAKLPDCRGYEMVSPLQKGNADVALWVGRNALSPLLFELHQSAIAGERFTYTSYTSFGDSEAATFVSQYLARRSENGWASKGLSPPHTVSAVGVALDGDFQGFSADLCAAWIRHYSVAPLAEGAIPEYPNIYRRESCATPPVYEALTTSEPSNRPAEKYFELRTQGFSADGSHTIFTANGKLGPDAPGSPPLGEVEMLLYEHTPEGLRFVCYLPNGNPVAEPCAAGTASGSGGGITSSVHNAISADGERIFWSAYSDNPGIGIDPGAPGRIFARIGGTQTVRISGTKAADPAWFWTAANDGSKAIFAFDSGALKDELYEVEVDTETPQLIAKGVEGPMGANEDASRIYFASSEDLDGVGEGTKGAHNLYLYEAPSEGGEPTYTFIMALAKADIGGYFTDPSPIDDVPSHRWARVSADGLHATFVSAASPTGYDNVDTASGEPAREVYHYDAVEDELRCVSCNPTGARPVANNVGLPGEPIFVAARIQGWEILNHAPRVMSEDGRRVFFESLGPLAPHDTNGVWDVYQWEETGKGTCTTSSASFSEANGGCIDLISSGDSGRNSTFFDADPSGESVFFGTLSSLVGSDYGLNDVYVARVGGGFPPPQPPLECEGGACQSPPPPPATVTPASEAFRGPGNEKATKCPRGKRKVQRKGKVRCVKKAKKRKGNKRKDQRVRKGGRR